MPSLNFPIAFSAGLVSFFAPCVVPLLPAYIAYVTGVSLEDLKLKGYAPYIKKLLLSSIFYILGFSLVFTILGTAAAGFGMTIRHYGLILQRVGGLVILILGLEFAGIINLPLLARELKLGLPSWTNRLGYFRAFFVGLIFALAWTPCVGAVLGSILTLAAVTSSVRQGALLLFVYSLGISVPFLFVSLTLASAPKYISFLTRHINVIAKLAGLLLAILGFLLLTNAYRYLNSWLFELAFSLG